MYEKVKLISFTPPPPSIRFTDAQHHKFLLEFLVSVGQSYLQQGRARDFLLDLLHLDVPSLFVMETEEEEGSTSTLQSDILASSVPEEFVQFLADYIHRNSLQELLLQEVETIWVSEGAGRGGTS